MEITVDNLLEHYPDCVPVAVAAKLLGKPVAWVHVGLEHGTLPFGSYANNGRSSFHIAPKALIRYIEGEQLLPFRAVIDAVAAATAKAVIKEINGGHYA